MKITFVPAELADSLEQPLRELIDWNAGEMSRGRCALHGAAPAGLLVTPGTEGNVIDFEIAGCCDEYELPDDEAD